MIHLRNKMTDLDYLFVRFRVVRENKDNLTNASNEYFIAIVRFHLNLFSITQLIQSRLL